MIRIFHRTIGVVLLLAAGMVFTAAHHQTEGDDLDSLKEAFNRSRDSWQSADVETYFSLIHPEASRIGTGGVLHSIMQDVDYEAERNRSKKIYEGREFQIDDLDFDIQDSVATA